MKQRNRAIRAPHLANASGPERIIDVPERHNGQGWGSRTYKPVTQLHQRGVVWF